MKTINEKFTDEEFLEMAEIKRKAENWHDYIMSIIKYRKKKKCSSKK